MNKLKFVDVESPYRGKNEKEVKRNILYARACIEDCLSREEIPFASHLFFNQPGILDDNVEGEREKSIWFGKTLIEKLPGVATVVYQNLGISEGMRSGIDEANRQGREIYYRNLDKNWEERALERAKNHSYASAWGFFLI